MAPKVCMTKLKKEMKAFLSNPPPHIPAIFVNERNILEWHFLLEGPPDTPYAGGWYIGKLRFPPEYPFKPPAIMMLTPSGRFATGTRLCLSMSDFHPESWNPMWTVSSILTGLLSFMLEDQITTGSLQSTNEEKQELAAASLDYNMDHAQLKAMFHSELQAAKSGSIQTDDQSASAQPTTNSQDGDLSSSTQTGPSDSIHQSGTSSEEHADARAHHSGVDAQAERLERMRIGDPSQAQSTSAVPASIQSAALDMLQKQLAEGQPEEALTQTEAALKHHQTQGDFCSNLLLLKAQAVAMIGDLQAAIDIVTEWQQTFRDNSSSAIVSSEAVDASSWQKAWQEAAEAKHAGNDLFRRCDFTGSLQAYDQSLSAAPKCAAVYCNKAAALAKLERHEEAIAAAKQALSLNKNYSKARRRINDSNAAMKR
ncbi:hypothetical protein WJX77_002298 [Trebouxia sp. C0004]